MVLIQRRTAVALCLLSVAGCVTDELAVFKKHVITKEAMKPFLGDYEVAKWPGEAKPENVSVTQKDGDFHFAYALPDQKIAARFVLSKIPNSKKDLYLLSLPSQDETDQANMFFVGQANKDRASIWIVFSNMPVAKEHLKFGDGKAKAEDVKKFLTTYADAFVTANEATVALKKKKAS